MKDPIANGVTKNSAKIPRRSGRGKNLVSEGKERGPSSWNGSSEPLKAPSELKRLADAESEEDSGDRIGGPLSFEVEDLDSPDIEANAQQSDASERCPSFCRIIQCNRVLTFSRINWLLLAMPVAIVSKAAGFGDGPTFVFSLLSLIPQAQLLGLFTEQIALYTNEAIGGLLNATFGNLTELIITIIALRRDMLRIVQVSLLGSILSNCLLVLGSAFLLGGIRFPVLKFNTQMATTNTGLLMISTMALLLPAALDASGAAQSDGAVLSFSRFTAVLLLFVYGLLLYFQIKTHRHLVEGGEAEEDEEEEEPILTLKEALIWLAIDTALVSFFSELLVGSVEGSAEAWGIPKVFIGMVIIPIVGNAAEHASAVLVAMKGKVELALGIAIGSAVQIALLGVPIAVVCAWMMNKPLSLDFHVFETASVLTSSLAVGFLVSDGEANYLKGAMLVVAYIIVSAGFFVHKDDEQL